MPDHNGLSVLRLRDGNACIRHSRQTSTGNEARRRFNAAFDHVVLARAVIEPINLLAIRGALVVFAVAINTNNFVRQRTDQTCANAI